MRGRREVWREALTKWGLRAEDGVPPRLSDVAVDRRLQAALDLRAVGAPFAWIAPRLALGRPESLRVRLHRLKNVTM
jgi:hypothetical protein